MIFLLLYSVEICLIVSGDEGWTEYSLQRFSEMINESLDESNDSTDNNYKSSHVLFILAHFSNNLV